MLFIRIKYLASISIIKKHIILRFEKKKLYVIHNVYLLGNVLVNIGMTTKGFFFNYKFFQRKVMK